MKMKIKKLKLFYMKAMYRFDYYVGPYTTNERKYDIFLRSLIDQQTRIDALEREINC